MKMNKEVVMVRISDIIPNRFQPRLNFDEEALNELTNSIKEHGIIQPLILRDLGNKYEIIAGERRYKAAQHAGLDEVPAIIGSTDDQTSAELALIENIQRKDLSAIEEAKSYKKILDMGNLTQEELAKRMGKGQSTVANKMRLLALTNEVQVALMNNLISERHARCLLQVKDEDIQKEVLNKIISERMNVRDTDEYIKNILGAQKNEAPRTNPIAVNTHPLENQSVAEIELPKKSEKIEPNITNSQLQLPEGEKTPDDNPNVYTQTNNIDFINISSLDSEDMGTNNNVKSALSDLDIISKESNIFSNSTLSVEDKNLPEMANNQNSEVIDAKPISEKEESAGNLLKVKLATAIRLAKDTVQDIKAAGYKVTLEEVDTDSYYQIIIKVQK